MVPYNLSLADDVIPSASEKSINLRHYIVKTLLGNLSTEYETYSLEKHLLQKEISQECEKNSTGKTKCFPSRFGGFITQFSKNVNLLNYRLSPLGDYLVVKPTEFKYVLLRLLGLVSVS